MLSFNSVDAFLKTHNPSLPVRCCRPFAVRRATQWFQDHFPGELIYAVKANCSNFVIEALIENGVTHFDVASVSEADQIASLLPSARIMFMNPVKSMSAIKSAYFDYGVRTFALDHPGELAKILSATSNADDLTLYVRLACNDAGSLLPLGEKYGVGGNDAVQLLKDARRSAATLGVTFHVGSQALQAERFGEAIGVVSDHLKRAELKIDALDIGGGFPVFYKAGDPSSLDHYMLSIKSALCEVPMNEGGTFYAEPGRALVADCESLLVQVDARRGADLFINDGAYGMLYDAAHCDWSYPVRLVGHDKPSETITSFRVWGPSCDAGDVLQWPFLLPNSVAEGDFIEIGLVGAYGIVMASGFNGFGRYEAIEVKDDCFGASFVQNLPAELRKIS